LRWDGREFSNYVVNAKEKTLQTKELILKLTILMITTAVLAVLVFQLMNSATATIALKLHGAL